MTSEETWKKCQTCSKAAQFMPDGNHCTNCWEVEHRLAEYLASEGGREYMAKALAKATAKG